MNKTSNSNAPWESHWAGLDVSKRFFDAAVAGPGQHVANTSLRDLPWKQFPRTKEGATQFVGWLDTCAVAPQAAGVRVVMEATGKYSIELTAWLLEVRTGLAPAIENAGRTKAFIDSLGQRNRTDGLAARALAFYGVERRPAPCEPLTPQRQKLRELSRFRDTLVGQRGALKNRRMSGISTKVVERMQTRQLRQLDRDIAKIEHEMDQVVKAHPPFQRDYKLLISIAGVGRITAMVVLAEVGDLRRFYRARQLTAYVGVSPSVVQSGSSIRGRTRMCKRGNRRVRKALYMSALAVLRTQYPNSLKAMYLCLCDHGKEKKSALGALMRKQLTVMRAVLIHGVPYNPLWDTCGQRGGKIAA